MSLPVFTRNLLEYQKQSAIGLPIKIEKWRSRF